MKNTIASATVFLVFVGLQIYLWGRLLLDIMRHPWRAFEVIVLPSIALSVLLALAAWIVRRKQSGNEVQSGKPSHVAYQLNMVMEQKTTEELLDIVVDKDKDRWSDMALEAAKKILKNRLLTPDGIDAIAKHKESYVNRKN